MSLWDQKFWSIDLSFFWRQEWVTTTPQIMSLYFVAEHFNIFTAWQLQTAVPRSLPWPSLSCPLWELTNATPSGTESSRILSEDDELDESYHVMIHEESLPWRAVIKTCEWFYVIWSYTSKLEGHALIAFTLFYCLRANKNFRACFLAAWHRKFWDVNCSWSGSLRKHRLITISYFCAHEPAHKDAGNILLDSKFVRLVLWTEGH